MFVSHKNDITCNQLTVFNLHEKLDQRPLIINFILIGHVSLFNIDCHKQE